jgi:hypothetical protein
MAGGPLWPVTEACYSSAMRYVIVFAAVAFFLAWDIVYNHGQYIDHGFRVMTNLVRSVTG